MIKLFAVTALILVGIAGSSAAEAASYSSLYVLKDARGTVRYHRSKAVKLAAIRRCGADRNDNVTNPELPDVLRCLRAQGWVVARTERIEVPRSTPSSATASAQDDGSSAATSDDDDDDSADVPSDDSSDDDAQQQAIDQQDSDMEQEELNEQAQSQQQTNDALAQSAEDNMQTQTQQ